MALQSSGAISLNNVNVELGLSGTTTISLNQASVRTLFGVASGAIRMSDGYGKSAFTPQALGFGYNSYWTADSSDLGAFAVDLETAGAWSNWSPDVIVSGAGPITLELRQYAPNTGNNAGCSNTTFVDSSTYGQAGVNYNNVVITLSNSNSNCTTGVYTGGSTCYKAGFYYFVISNPYNSFIVSTWNVRYGYYDYQCYCPSGCSVTSVCGECDYDCSGDCATGYGAVCDCDPGADDWCEPNCPCSPYSCSYVNQCSCNEECGNVFQVGYQGYDYGNTCAGTSL